MKTENCAEITDAKRIELKSGLTEPVKNDKYSSFIVPAGILIGLGVGLLVDYLLSGFFVGLGFGLICSELYRLVEKSREAESTQLAGVNVTTLLIGVFVVVIGFGIVLVPAAILPYAIAGFLILTGNWFLVL